MATVVGMRDGTGRRRLEHPFGEGARVVLDAAATPTLRLALGLALLLGVVLAGFLVHLPQIAHHDLRLDVALADRRTPTATALALALTWSAQEAVGLAVVGLGVLVLLVRHRVRPAVQLVLIAGLAWGLASLLKAGIDRARPPAALELLAPDASPSFPSGHTTTAAIVVVVVWAVLAGAGRLRVVATAAALAFAGGVAASRVYLADHYPTDVAASLVLVLAAVLLVTGAMDAWPARRAARSGAPA